MTNYKTHNSLLISWTFGQITYRYVSSFFTQCKTGILLTTNLLILNVLDDRLELEAKVEAASDERHSLLERCLGAESELDRSRSTLVELRRKLDDSQAALQELGRENQSIQGG